jgi:hypothetical protein
MICLNGQNNTIENGIYKISSVGSISTAATFTRIDLLLDNNINWIYVYVYDGTYTNTRWITLLYNDFIFGIDWIYFYQTVLSPETYFVNVISITNIQFVMDNNNQVMQNSSNGVFPNIDGIVTNVNDIICLAGQTIQRNNGLYIVTSIGSIWTPYTIKRVAYMNSWYNIKNETIINVSNGINYSGTIWTMKYSGNFTLGVTPLIFTQIIYSNKSVNNIVTTDNNKNILLRNVNDP